MNQLEDKIKKLEKWFKDQDDFAIAFSGGVDSTLLAAIAKKVCKKKVVLITCASQFQTKKEIEGAKRTAKKIGLEHFVLNVDVLQYSDILKNTKKRCYFCKARFFSKIREKALDIDISTLIHGVNLDDLSDYRPGLIAASELGFIEPYVNAGLYKKDIRKISKDMGLKTWDMPSGSCLAARIPFGQKVTEKKLLMIEKAEEYLNELGFKIARVRCHKDVARIETDPGAIEKMMHQGMRAKISKRFKDIGFKYCSIDIDGYVTGSMN